MRPELVCQVIADLRFYEFLTTVSIYQSTNRYRPTIAAHTFLKNDRIRDSILSYAMIDVPIPVSDQNQGNQVSQPVGVPSQSQPQPKIQNHQIFSILREFNNDTPISKIKKFFHLQEIFKIIDLKKFTMVCEAYGLLKRLYDYPILPGVFKGDIKFDSILCDYAEWRREVFEVLEKHGVHGHGVEGGNAHHHHHGLNIGAPHGPHHGPHHVPYGPMGTNHPAPGLSMHHYPSLYGPSSSIHFDQRSLHRNASQNFKGNESRFLMDKNCRNLRKELIRMLENKYGEKLRMIYK